MRGFQNPCLKPDKSGQSVVEVALTLPFLLVIIIGLVEMGILFSTYIALVNGAREGTIYASIHPELADSGLTPTTSSIWIEFQERVNNEVNVAVGERLREGQLIDRQTLTVDRPVLGPAVNTGGLDCTPPSNIGCPITVTVKYQLHTFLNDVNVPTFGRLGLPSAYTLTYGMAIPIR